MIITKQSSRRQCGERCLEINTNGFGFHGDAISTEARFFFIIIISAQRTWHFISWSACDRPYIQRRRRRVWTLVQTTFLEKEGEKKENVGINLRVSRMGGLVRNNSLNALFWFFVIAGRHENRILWCNLSSSRQVCQLENMDDVGVPNEVTSESELIWTYLLFYYFFLLLSNKSRKGHRVSLYISK